MNPVEIINSAVQNPEFACLTAGLFGLLGGSLYLNARQYIENRKLRTLSVIDPLTQLYNRQFLYRQLPIELARADRQNWPTSLFLCDVDHFKLINDTYGHPVGDATLQALAELMRVKFRRGDLLFRYGGEEFLIVLTNTALHEARDIAERFRSQVPVGLHNVVPNVTLSIGIVSTSEEGIVSDMRLLIKRADSRLYFAKNTGRNRIVFADKNTHSL